MRESAFTIRVDDHLKEAFTEAAGSATEPERSWSGSGVAVMSETPWHVYLLECADGTVYCGMAKDVGKRLAQHNGELPGGARYTSGRRPVRLLGSRECESQGEALRLERSVKRLPRGKKLSFFFGG